MTALTLAPVEMHAPSEREQIWPALLPAFAAHLETFRAFLIAAHPQFASFCGELRQSLTTNGLSAGSPCVEFEIVAPAAEFSALTVKFALRPGHPGLVPVHDVHPGEEDGLLAVYWPEMSCIYQSNGMPMFSHCRRAMDDVRGASTLKTIKQTALSFKPDEKAGYIADFAAGKLFP